MVLVKETRGKRPFEGGLGRQGAIRQRKEEMHEIYGHKFIMQQFYQIMRCALCGELLKNAAGYQCEDCKYTCHKKCYSKVVTKCISKTNAETVHSLVNADPCLTQKLFFFANLSILGS